MTLPRRHLAILGISVSLIHIAAFFVAAGLLYTHEASMQAMIGKMDQVEYIQLADTMLSSGRFALSPEAPPEVFRTPGYPALIALAKLLTGHWYWAIFVIHGLLVGGIAVLTALLAATLGFSRRASLAAGGIIGVSSGPLLLSMTGTGSDILYTLLYALSTLVAIQERPTLARAALVGAILGLATLTRPIGILASLPAIAGFALLSQDTWRKYARMTAAAAVGFAAVLAPWYLRNAAVTGTPLLSTVSTFNVTWYNIPMSDAFWTRGDESAIRTAFVARTGTTSTDALRGAAFLPAMRDIDGAYLRTHTLQYGIFHLYRTIPFFFMSGYNVINAVLAHEAPALRSSLFPTESDNLTRHITSHEWGAALHALGAYWFTTLERLSWFVAILLAFAAPFFARGRNRRILLVFAAIIVANIILISPVTQARYRFPAEPYIWVAAVYTGVTLWNRYRDRTA